MAITDSRIKGGSLTLDNLTTFAKQITSCSLEPAEATEGEEIETMTGDKLSAAEVTTWVLNLGSIQDFDDAMGLVEFARQRAGEEVEFTWKPNDVAMGPTYSGVVKIRALTIGGEVATRLTNTKAWPVVGDPVPSY